MTPSIGRIVHMQLTAAQKQDMLLSPFFEEPVKMEDGQLVQTGYDILQQNDIAAAFIVRVNEDGSCNLVVAGEFGCFKFFEKIQQGTAPGTWCEPARV